MKLIDLNILLYAINPSIAQHKTILRWWELTLDTDEPVALSWVVINGFIRLSTNPKIFPSPLSTTTALNKVENWLNLSNVRIIRETEQHWTILKELLEKAGVAGNLTTDAHLAALAIGHGATLISCDHDFMRFEKLRWENPLARKI